MSELNYSRDEMMVVAASRMLKDNEVVFIGIGLPSKAANLARKLHARNLAMIYESGTVDTIPSRLPLSIGDDELSLQAKSVVSVPEMFRYWLQGGKIKVGFLGAAQVDKYGNINTTVIGDYDHPKVRLPGAGGAPEIASHCEQSLIMLRQTNRNFVDKLDFISSFGFGSGGDERERLGIKTRGPQAIITDLGILEPDPQSREMTLTHLHPGVTVEQAIENTGWSLKTARELKLTPSPTAREMEALRSLEEYA